MRYRLRTLLILLILLPPLIAWVWIAYGNYLSGQFAFQAPNFIGD